MLTPSFSIAQLWFHPGGIGNRFRVEFAGEGANFRQVFRGLKLFKYWIPALLWMLVIYGASGDSLSFQRTSRFLGPLLHWLRPSLTAEQLRSAMFYTRKAGHVFEYAVLAALLWFALRHLRETGERRWSWWVASQAFLLSIAYAITDEFHQKFVPTRQGTPWDILIDTCGAVLGLIIVYGFHKLREMRHAARTDSGNRPDQQS
jgi:VanZ family protein